MVVGSPDNFGRTRELGFSVQGFKSRQRRKVLEQMIDRAAIAERSGGLERIRLLRQDGSDEYVQADEPAYSMGRNGNFPRSRRR